MKSFDNFMLSARNQQVTWRVGFDPEETFDLPTHSRCLTSANWTFGKSDDRAVP
jgi:hypothetical protein